jgi:hypothetical protein
MARHCGTNIPFLEYRDCAGLKTVESHTGNRSFCWINEENLYWFLSNPHYLHLLKDSLHCIKSKKYFALFDVSDIKPFMIFLCWIFRRLAGRLIPTKGNSIVRN